MPSSRAVRIFPLPCRAAGRRGPFVCVGRGGLDAVSPRRGGYALARTFPRVTLAAPADGVRMLLCPSSHRTRTRGGCSWSTSSITPARLGCATFSDSTTILSPAWGLICVSPSCSDSLVLLDRLARPFRRCTPRPWGSPGPAIRGHRRSEADVAKSGPSLSEGRRGSVLGDRTRCGRLSLPPELDGMSVGVVALLGA